MYGGIGNLEYCEIAKSVKAITYFIPYTRYGSARGNNKTLPADYDIFRRCVFVRRVAEAARDSRLLDTVPFNAQGPSGTLAPAALRYPMNLLLHYWWGHGSVWLGTGRERALPDRGGSTSVPNNRLRPRTSSGNTAAIGSKSAA